MTPYEHENKWLTDPDPPTPREKKQEHIVLGGCCLIWAVTLFVLFVVGPFLMTHPATTSTAPTYLGTRVPAPSGYLCMHFNPIPGATFPPTTESNITVTIDATGETICTPLEETE